MMRTWALASCVLMANAAKAEETFDCGVVSSYMACIALDPESVGSYGEFLNDIGPPASKSSGYSLEQLKKAIDSTGLHTLAVTSDIEMLARHWEQQQALAIAHLDESHFVLFSAFGHETVEVSDFPRVYTMGEKELKEQWKDRVCLLVATQPIEKYRKTNWLGVLVAGCLGLAVTGALLKWKSR